MLAGKKRKALIFLMFTIDYLLIAIGIIGIINGTSFTKPRAIDFLAICIAGVAFLTFKLLMAFLYKVLGKVRGQMALYYASLACLFILSLLTIGIIIPHTLVHGLAALFIILVPYICYEMANNNEKLLKKLEDKHITEK